MSKVRTNASHHTLLYNLTIKSNSHTGYSISHTYLHMFMICVICKRNGRHGNEPLNNRSNKLHNVFQLLFNWFVLFLSNIKKKDTLGSNAVYGINSA